MSSGTLAGTVVDGSRGLRPVPDLVVTLQLLSGAQTQTLGSTSTDSNGKFYFSNLDPATDVSYSVTANYEKGTFASPVVSFGSGFAQSVTLTVYDVTSSDAAIHVVSETVLLGTAHQAKGVIPGGEFVVIQNQGTRAYVGSLTSTGAMPVNLLRFSTPSGATNVTLGAGFNNAQIVQVATGFGVIVTVPPGESTSHCVRCSIRWNNSHRFPEN